jgi:transcriptional regulator with XRE-family HTH domain
VNGIGDFMIQISKEKLYNFSKYISKLRKEHGYTLNEVAAKTNLKPTALHKIENAEFQKINPVFLSNLAKLYNINILVFYTMLGYINEDEVILFSEILKKQNYTLKEEIISQSLKIPVVKNKKEFSNSTNKFLNIKNNDFFAFYYSNKYYIFKKTDTLNIDDTGIFEIQNKINIGKYATEGNFIFISDLSSTDIFFREKSEISILGKVFYIIEVT